MNQHTATFLPANRVVVGSFVEGFRLVKSDPPRRDSEDDIFAHALWLQNHKGLAAADQFLEEYLRRYSN